MRASKAVLLSGELPHTKCFPFLEITMPRRDEDDRRHRRSPEEDDYRDGPPRKSNPVLWVVLAVVGVCFFGTVLVAVLGLFLWSSPAPPPAPVPVATGGPVGAMKQLRGREELKALVTGKTPEEVKNLLGAPDRSRESDGNPVWTYEGITRDPAGGDVELFFEGGKVAKVVF